MFLRRGSKSVGSGGSHAEGAAERPGDGPGAGIDALTRSQRTERFATLRARRRPRASKHSPAARRMRVQEVQTRHETHRSVRLGPLRSAASSTARLVGGWFSDRAPGDAHGVLPCTRKPLGRSAPSPKILDGPCRIASLSRSVRSHGPDSGRAEQPAQERSADSAKDPSPADPGEAGEAGKRGRTTPLSPPRAASPGPASVPCGGAGTPRSGRSSARSA